MSMISRFKKRVVPEGVLEPGSAAPNFTLSDQKGERHSLSEYRSEWVLLYFYSKEEAEACTEEECFIRDDFMKLRARRVNVMGVSPRSIQDNYAFAKKFGLSFRLLADIEKKVAKMYGVIEKRERNGKMADSVGRIAILVSPRGKIEKVYRGDSAAQADMILADLMQIPETQNRRVAPEDMKIPGIPDRRFSLD
jgi:thioredoxin-dependent peroxiredoxin